jgi:hypothetical protein
METEVLTSTRVRAAVASRGIRLTTFGAVARSGQESSVDG